MEMIEIKKEDLENIFKVLHKVIGDTLDNKKDINKTIKDLEKIGVLKGTEAGMLKTRTDKIKSINFELWQVYCQIHHIIEGGL